MLSIYFGAQTGLGLYMSPSQNWFRVRVERVLGFRHLIFPAGCESPGCKRHLILGIPFLGFRFSGLWGAGGGGGGVETSGV